MTGCSGENKAPSSLHCSWKMLRSSSFSWCLMIAAWNWGRLLNELLLDPHGIINSVHWLNPASINHTLSGLHEDFLQIKYEYSRTAHWFLYTWVYSSCAYLEVTVRKKSPDASFFPPLRQFHAKEAGHFSPTSMCKQWKWEVKMRAGGKHKARPHAVHWKTWHELRVCSFL